MKSKKAREARRASVVDSLHVGYPPEEVAQQHQVSLATVYNHFNRFKDEGRKGLTSKPISGRPSKATPDFRQRLVEVIESGPASFKLGFSVWALPSLQAFMERETGGHLSQNRLSEVLQEEGYVYRRPKKDLSHKQGADLREQVKKALEEVKKTPEISASGYSLWMKVDSV